MASCAWRQLVVLFPSLPRGSTSTAGRFHWANSLCLGANLPLPVPLKVDKVPGGARLGFITIRDGGAPGPHRLPRVPAGRRLFSGLQGDSRIMRSLLLQALQKFIEIARL